MTENIYFCRTWNRYILYTFLIVLAFGLFTAFRAYSEWFFSIFLVPFVAWLVQNWIKRSKNQVEWDFVIQLFVFGFILRLIYIYAFSEILDYYNGFPFLSLRDDKNYNEAANQMVRRWEFNDEIVFYNDITFGSGTYSGYPFFSALCMLIFGKSVFVPRIIQSIFSAFTVILFYKIANTYTTQRRARMVGIIAGCSPLLAIFSSLQLKDTMLVFFSITCLYALVMLYKKGNNFKSLFLFVFFLPCIFFFRPASVFPFIVVPLAISLFERKHFIRSIIFTVIITFIAYYFWNYFTHSAYFMLSDDFIERQYEVMMERDFTDTNSNLAQSTSLAQYVGAPLFLILGLFLPCPLLATLNGAETINYTFFPLIFNLTLYPFIITGLVIAFKSFKKQESVIPMLIIMIFLVYKIGQAMSLQTMLSARQSLVTISLLYLFIPFCPMNNSYKRLKKWSFILGIVVMIIYTCVRMYSHGQLF